MRPFLFMSLVILGGFSCSKKTEQLDSAKIPEMLWKTALSENATTETISMDPVVYNDLVIYAANDGIIDKSKLVALNRVNGKVIWEWKNSHENAGDITTSHSYVYDNTLVVPILGRPYQIVGIDMEKGNELWHYTLPEGGSFQIVGSKNLVFHIRGNLDRMKDEIFMADVRLGNWQSVYAASNINAPIYIQGMQVYQALDHKNYLAFLVAKYKDFQFSATESTLFKYSIDSNKIVYSKKLDFLPKSAQPYLKAVAQDKFWFRSNPVIALEESTGEKVLDFFVPPTISTTAGEVAIAGDKLLMTTVNKLVCFNATSGKYLWQESGNTSGTSSRILYHNNVIYYTSMGDGKFHAINATTGQTIYDVKSPDLKSDGSGSFDTAITLDTINKRVYTASYFGAICYKMPQ